MNIVQEWVIMNVSKAYISIKLRDASGNVVRSIGIAPGKVEPVRNIFRAGDGSADVEAARANADVKAQQEKGRVKLVERDRVQRVGKQRPLFNHDDPEEDRVAKVLAHRNQFKKSLRARAKPPARVQPQPQPSRTGMGRRKSADEESTPDKE